MGCPDIYYKNALLIFLKFLGKNISKSKNIRELEFDILLEKEIISENFFYYEAGRACQEVLTEVLKYDGCDALNACIGGLILFEDFLKLENNEI